MSESWMLFKMGRATRVPPIAHVQINDTRATVLALSDIVDKVQIEVSRYMRIGVPSWYQRYGAC